MKDPGDDKAKKCKEYFEVAGNLPSEVQYSITEHEGIIYLLFNSKKHFYQIFDHKGDGFAIDIIKREQYPCGSPNTHANSWAHKGRLMPPLYKEAFESRGQIDRNNVFVIRYGQVPPDIDPKTVEYNLLIVQKNWLCDSRYFYKIDYDTWSLLESGLYRDSLSTETTMRFGQVNKTVNFTVPFEKDQVVFDELSVKPIYDTLNLTDYYIKRITIEAFSSVEGPLDRNIKLQEGRAQSIVDALKSYQSESIVSEIRAKENWEEFHRDITGTGFASMAELSKDDVKAKFAGNDPLLDSIEPILSKHRKALIEIDLEKRIAPEKSSPEMLKSLFAQSLQQENLDEALYLQQVIFDRIGKQELPESFLGELELPESNPYFSLHNNQALFLYDQSPDDLNKGIENFEKLLKFLPDNQRLLYNLTVLKIRRWAISQEFSKPRDILNHINELERSRLEPDLLRTLKINHSIVLTKYLNEARDFAGKNKSLRTIYNTYRREPLGDDDLLRLAKYMTYYSRFDWAFTLLKTRAIQPDASTDIIFYYLNLTITDPRKTRRLEYQNVLSRAIERDKDRFCNLFLAKSQGGITFQLLGDVNLKKRFCEVCNVN
ncbi:MAG: hypothetical protein Roseis2KO_00500 [Roseivirga sp.]